MGRLDEFRKVECFPKIEKTVRNLAAYAKRDAVRRDWYDYNRLYRILTSPVEELDRWEKEGGYDPEKSMWHRFVCTSNRYLACMVKMELNPPWLRKPQVMIEVHELYPKCVKYSDAAVGNVPTIPEVDGKRADDLYVSQEDLPLLECWLERKVGTDEIKKIYVDEEADEEVKKRVRDFAEKHKIPVEDKLPCPSDDDKVMREWDRPGAYGVTDEGLKELVGFLKKRSKSCWRYVGRPPSDSVAAALAESSDEAFHREWPLGASDAISKRNERLRERPPFSLLPPELECDTVICSKTGTVSLEGMKRELERKMERLRREGK